MKSLCLCADDFALSLAGSQRIIELIGKGRLSATCVMSQSPYWPELAKPLAELSGQADMGLHFNLTEPFDHEAKPLLSWLLRSQLRALNKEQIKQCLLQQIDLFSDHFQRLPDFIDGHQHVHALPVIRQALFEAIALRWQGQPLPYVRAPDCLLDSGDATLKGRVLTACCRGFSAQLKQQGLVSPQVFAGLYSLSPVAEFAGLMQRWLANVPDQGLIMCHPGVSEAGDDIGPAREAEYRYLLSEQFVQDCQARQVNISRYIPS